MNTEETVSLLKDTQAAILVLDRPEGELTRLIQKAKEEYGDHPYLMNSVHSDLLTQAIREAESISRRLKWSEEHFNNRLSIHMDDSNGSELIGVCKLLMELKSIVSPKKKSPGR